MHPRTSNFEVSFFVTIDDGWTGGHLEGVDLHNRIS